MFDLFAQLQRGRQQRVSGQPFAPDEPPYPPELVLGPVEPGQRLPFAGQVVELAALLRLAYLLLDHRLVAGPTIAHLPAPLVSRGGLSSYRLCR
jgi:hypothetical protein